MIQGITSLKNWNLRTLLPFSMEFTTASVQPLMGIHISLQFKAGVRKASIICNRIDKGHCRVFCVLSLWGLLCHAKPAFRSMGILDTKQKPPSCNKTCGSPNKNQIRCKHTRNGTMYYCCDYYRLVDICRRHNILQE